MPKVTSKLQLTVPKLIAERFGIRPGDELQWIAVGKAIRVILAGKGKRGQKTRTVKERLELFDQATQRLRRRQARMGKAPRSADRGWKREDLRGRGLSD